MSTTFTAQQLSASGAITGFSSINLGQSNTPEVFAPTHFTLAEVSESIQAIRNNFDPSFLDALIVQILSHVQNTNNPHQVSLAQTGVNVVQMVYQTWLSLGNVGTLQDFYAIFFQITPLASASDITSGTSANLVSVLGVTQLITTHNTDLNAHVDLLTTIMPGTPPTAVPNFAFDAKIGVPAGVSLVCSTGITVLDRNGNLVTIPPNTAGIDYSTGHALIPLYGARTNTIVPSSPLLAPSGWLVNTTLSTAPSGTLKTGPDGQSCAVLSDTNALVLHGYAAPITYTQGLEYTSSLFLYPLQATGGVTIYLDAAPSLAVMLNLATLTLTTTATPGLFGYVQVFHNGWIRVGIQYVAPTTGAANLMVVQSASGILGQALPYVGTTTPLFGLFGLQHVQGCGMSPYLATTTIAVSHAASVMTLPTSVINATAGLLSVTYDQAYQITAQSRSLVALGSNFSLISNAGQISASIENTDGTVSYLNLPTSYNHLVTTAFAFSAGAYGFGTTGQPTTTLNGKTYSVAAGPITLTLGNTSGLSLDGGIQALALYPVGMVGDEIDFLIGIGPDVSNL